jgi:hypothetical protein
MPRTVPGSETAALPGLTGLSPSRIDGIVANQTGRAQLTASYPGVRFSGGSEVQILVVDHGAVRPGDAQTRPGELLSWQPSWWDVGDGGPARSGLAGYVVFRVRQGEESLDVLPG